MTTIIDTSYYQPTMILDSRWNWLLGEDEEHLRLSIEDRIHQLETEAKEYRLWSITSMITSGVGVMTGVALFSIPVLGVLAGSIPLAGFLWSVIGDGNYTGKSTLAEIVASMGHWEDPDAEFNKLANFMEEHEAIEYKFLVKYQEPLIEHLMDFQDLRGRVIQYQQKLREFRFDRPLEFQERQGVDPERMKELLDRIFGDDTPTVIQQTRLPQAPPKVNRAHAVEVIGNLPPAKTQSQQAPTVLQDDLLYSPNTNPTVIQQDWQVPSNCDLFDRSEINTNFSGVGEFLDACDKSGFPIRKLLHHPLVWLVAPSQSGKSTFASILQGLRYLSGYPIIWASGDIADMKEKINLPWQSTHYGVAEFALLTDALESKITKSGKDEMKLSVMLDEINFAISGGVEIQELLDKTLIKGNKVKFRCIAGVHADTLKALGLEGIKELLVKSRALVELGRVPDPDQDGEWKPSGKMTVTIEGFTEEWSIPSWMGKDPFGFLVKSFPQLTVTNISQAPSKKEQWLGTVRKAEDIQAPQDQEEDLSDLTEAEQAVVKFAKGKGDWVKARNVQQATMKDLAGYSTTQIRDLFAVLNEKGWGELQGSGDRLQFRYF